MGSKSQDLFLTIRSEGAILPPDLLQRIVAGDRELDGLKADDYHLPKGEKINEATSRAWNRLLGVWASFRAAIEKLPEADPATTATRERWLQPFFQELGYGRLLTAKAIEVEGKSYAISHGWNRTPIHLVGCHVDLDRSAQRASGASRSSPHSLLQETLNRSTGHLWGFVANGLQMRVLRNNASLSRQAFVEFDLEAMMLGENYADYVLLWLLCHQSRVEADNPNDCWLEKWSQASKERGVRALDHLRRGVEQAITSLGRGFLSCPSNRQLRDHLRVGTLDPQDYYRQLLIARADTTLEELVDSSEPGTGIQPLLEALDSLVSPGDGDLFIPSNRAHSAWLFALAWLTRDQECRYDHILDWRHARADTRSPVLGTSREQMVVAVRSLLGVLDQEEIRLKDERDGLAEKRRSMERDLTYYQRRIEQLRSDLSSALGTQDNAASGGELELGEWRTRAESRLEREDDTVPVDAQRAQLATARNERDGVLGEAAVVGDDLRRMEGTLALHQEQVRALRGERANLDATEIKAKLGPVCPVCNVPIDRALAESCQISNVFLDAAEVAQDRRTVADQMKDCTTAIGACQTDIAAGRRSLAQLRQRQTGLENRIATLEAEIDRASRQNRQRWAGKQRVIESVTELQGVYDDVSQSRRNSGELVTKDEQLRDRQAELRASHQDVLKRFDELFGYVCRGVLGNDISASVSLTGLGIQADVQVGGMAMESLKGIAFDLAATLMSIEGRTVVPAFLVHDSPREADLGVSIYHRWFRFIASLEKLSAESPFQYIITTTSEPPQELRSSGFVVETLHGAEPTERLLRRELG